MGLYRTNVYAKSLVVVGLIIVLNQVNAAEQKNRKNELRNADQQLNLYYQKIMSRLHPSQHIKFRSAQQQWLIFRDLDCSWAFKGEPYVCLIERTKNRTKEFQENSYLYIYSSSPDD